MVGKVSGKTARISNMVIIYALLILFGLLCLFPFFQKYFDKGILIGSLKG